MKNQSEIAVFGGGCFWCTEAIFLKFKGVIKVTPGYAGGTVTNPDYQKVGSGNSGHAEVIKIEFDPEIISYQKLLEIFWEIHDPTSLNKQGNDTGTQYRSIILYTDETQKKEAERSKNELEESGKFDKPIVTQIKSLDKFYNAEEYHHNYYAENKFTPYCSIVISPKIHKVEEIFKTLLK